MYSVKVVAPPEGVDGQDLRSAVNEVLETVDAQMSGYRRDSEVSRFNASDRLDWFEVSPELAEVTSLALRISEASAGAFDITLAPLVEAWGFGVAAVPAHPPEEKQLSALRAQTGWRRLHVQRAPPALRKETPSLRIDLNAIAPGFAADLIARRFAALGVERYMIDIGGEVRARGLNASGEPWRVAVEWPSEEPRAPYAIVQVENGAIATSGEYRRAYLRKGRRVSHTIDPRTARPVEHTLASVAVVSQSAAAADAWSTAFNVLGPIEGFALATRLGIGALFIEQSARGLRARTTPPFRESILYVAPEERARAASSSSTPSS